MVKKIKKLMDTGFLHIVGAGTLNKIISLCSGIVIVRVLSQYSYGIYSYILNIIDIFLIFDGLGTLTGILQYGCENREQFSIKTAIIKFGLKMGLASATVLTAAIIVYGVSGKQAIGGTGFIFCIAAFIPIFNYLNNAVGVILRVENENKKYGFYSVLSSFLVMASILLGAIFFEVEGAISFRYIAFVVLMIYALYSFNGMREILFKKNNVPMPKKMKRSFVSFSLISCANNSIAHLFYSMDIFLIGVLLVDPNIIASYKVATTIPFALTFLTNSIVTYIYPMYVKHKEDYEWIRQNYKSLLKYLIIMNGLIAVVGIVFAPFIIRLIHGEIYVGQSTDAFRVLMVGFFFSSVFRIPAGNILDMFHQVKANFYISIICGPANIVLDYFLIMQFNAIGAAIATSLVYILYGILSNILIYRYCKGVKQRNEK